MPTGARTNPDEADGAQAAAAPHDRYIPIATPDLLQAIVDDEAFGDVAHRQQFAALCRLLAAILNHQYFDRLEALRRSYLRFDPELGSEENLDPAAHAEAYRSFIDRFVPILEAASFVEVSAAEIARAYQEGAAVRASLEAPIEDFHEIRAFRRGLRTETVEAREWAGLRRRDVDVEVHCDVVVLAAIRPQSALGPKQLKRLARSKLRPGCVLIKSFRNVAGADIDALFPNVRVTMSLVDKLMLGVPAVVGGVPLVLKLWPSATVLVVVLGFYLGITGSVEDADLPKALAALGVLVAAGAFLLRQWVRYDRQSLKYHKEISDKLQSRSTNTNAGFFDSLAGAAEEQETRKAFLAYCFVRAARAPPTRAEINDRVAAWLKTTFNLKLVFEVDTAAAKLEGLGLVTENGGRLSALAPERALAQLDSIWDGFFTAPKAVAQ